MKFFSHKNLIAIEASKRERWDLLDALKHGEGMIDGTLTSLKVLLRGSRNKKAHLRRVIAKRERWLRTLKHLTRCIEDTL